MKRCSSWQAAFLRASQRHPLSSSFLLSVLRHNILSFGSQAFCISTSKIWNFPGTSPATFLDGEKREFSGRTNFGGSSLRLYAYCKMAAVKMMFLRFTLVCFIGFLSIDFIRLLVRRQWSPVTGALANVIDWLIDWLIGDKAYIWDPACNFLPIYIRPITVTATFIKLALSAALQGPIGL